MQLLIVAVWMTPYVVKWSSPKPQLDQHPTTPAFRATFPVMEAVSALVKLMECGLEVHPPVKVRTCHPINQQ